MSKYSMFVSGVAAVALASAANGAVVSYYNFNSLSIATAGTAAATGTTTISPSSGSGSLSLAGFAGNVDDFGGSTINALGGDPAEESLSLIAGGPAGGPYPGNGGTVVFSFSLTGLSDPILTFATQRTGTGFTGNQLAYSTDGTNFTDVGSPVVPAASFALQTFDLSAVNALDGAANVFLRLTLNGATSNSGNNRIDNVQINASGVPEPTTLAALGGAVSLFLRRRRA